MKAITVILLFYCVTCQTRNATVYHDLSTDTYQIAYDTVDAGFGTAFGIYEDAVDSTGWAFFTVGTGPQFAHLLQYKATGILEGALSAKHIDYYGTNQYAEWGFTPSTIPPKLKDFMTQNLAYMRAGPPTQNLDPVEKAIWDQVASLLAQFDGIVEGYTKAVEAYNYSLSESSTLVHQGKGFNELDLFLLQSAGDMETLVGVYSDIQRSPDPYARMLDCSALVRLTADDLYMGHATWRGYTLMNRVYKDIAMNGVRTSFSSQPGFISSKDDFYMTGYNLAVYETTNGIFDKTLYSKLTPKSLLTWVRTTVANYCAKSGSEWTDYFSRYNSGTYNNQFGVVDMNLYTPGKSLSAGTFWIIEQIPGFTHRDDVTAVLSKQCFWPSYNVPYFKDIFNMSGYTSAAQTNPDKYDYNKCARAQIFGRDAPNVSKLHDMMKIMRSNEYTTDPLSKGDPTFAIAARKDLSKNKPSAGGAVDGKVTSYSLLFPKDKKTNEFGGWAISGPTHQNPKITPPFSWSAWPKVSHVGQPSTFDFQWVEVPRTQLPTQH